VGEPPSITERRRHLNEVITTINNSIKVIQRDPDITAAGMDEDDELSQEIVAAQHEEQAQKNEEKLKLQEQRKQQQPQVQ
jgi:hypothetical protein